MRRPIGQLTRLFFAVITRSTRATPLTLPFLGALGLRSAVKRLDALGCPVKIATIRQERD